MEAIAQKIANRLNGIFENTQANQASWKNPDNPDYDRQRAEDALYHTIGPLTSEPRWSGSWTSPGEPVPEFSPGGPAPQWTQKEIAYAYAGDPALLFRGSGNPRSPEYGNKGGSPMLRLAKRVARFYARATDRSFIADLFGNGSIELAQSMQPGFDEARSPFISWVSRNVQSAMEHGIGGENRTSRAAGDDSTTGLRGAQALLKEKDPDAIRQAASVVKGEFQNQRRHDKHDDNPFGPFSSAYYQSAMAYADALESKDEVAIEKAQNRLRQLIDDIDEYSTNIRGASTGLGQAISTPDRKTSIGVASIDAPGSSDNAAGMAGNIVGDGDDSSTFDPETIEYVLNIALKHDIGKVLAGSKRYAAMAAEMDPKGGMGGVMTVNELRYVIRTLGPLGSNYPGRGQMRANADVPRDSRGWWQPGEDPEIEPLRGGEGTWKSIWTRNGFQSVGPTAITEEMTEEVREFEKLGIPTARQIKVKNKAGGKQLAEVVSKVAVANTIKAATVKLKIIAHIHREQLGLDTDDSYTTEDRRKLVSAGVLSESLDAFDSKLIAEACYAMVTKMNRALTFDPRYRVRQRNVIESRRTKAKVS